MIITVTMNPAIDKTVDLERFEHGGLNRVSNVIMDAGGKGINVSKTIKELGGETIATGFQGGSSGTLILDTLNELGINSDFVKINKEIRTNLKVVENNGFVTEFNEPGPMITPEELELLVNKLVNYAKEDVLFVFSGSIPKGIDPSIYGSLIKKVKEKGAKVLLDADGELFVGAVDTKPDIIKPNRHELEKYFSLDYRADENELIQMGNQLLDKGIKLVAISLGQMGALFLTKERKVRCPGLKVEAHSTVGAGDAMVAALSYGYDQGFDFLDMVKLSMATSAGAVITKGTKPPNREVVEQLIKDVEIIEI
ncbi:MAG: 1-phosphofructokinase [Clostridiales bacterium]|nr:1-phosphofructokinase [Clostridiales bacterium]